MNQSTEDTDNDTCVSEEVYPVEPRYHPVNSLARSVYDFFASAKLAMFLLVAVLLCCLAGTTIYRDVKAWEVIFSTLWFNLLLILLIINVACCFFGRIWGRRITVISFGMILFHLSFVTMFLGIVYNSFYYFRATIRLTEGETLSNADERSYDSINHGRLYSMSSLKGETSLIKMHRGYRVDGKDKRAAYEISVGEGQNRIQDIIYFTRNLTYKGYTYLPDREGYSALAVVYDKSGTELYGAHLPLQSLMQKDKSYLYTTGSKENPGMMEFPQKPTPPLFNMNLAYYPDPAKERSGTAQVQLWPLAASAQGTLNEKSDFVGKGAIGAKFPVGDFIFSVPEIRYWVVMNVRYEPGKPIILSSLWIGLFGITLTTLGRMFGKRKLHTAVVTDNPV